MRRALPLLLLLLLAAPAQATRVSADVDRFEDIRSDDIEIDATVRVRAAPGERNRIRVRALPGDRIAVRDAAGLTAGRRCRRTAPTAAVCRVPASGFRTLRVRLGDRDDTLDARRALAGGAGVAGNGFRGQGGPGDDRLRAARGGGALLGGPGDDRLRGDRGSDALRGQAGDDRLVGAGGADLLADGAGRDRVRGGAGGDRVVSAVLAGDRRSGGRAADRAVSAALESDRFDGGPGRDTVSFERFDRPLRIVADRAVAGDAVRGFEGYTGGDGDDVLVGSDGPDTLDGGPGDDRVEGRGGDDEIRAPRGGDVVRAGAGDDVVADGFFAGRVDVGCGPGDDRAPRLGEQALLRPDCEALVRELSISPLVPAQPLAVTPTRVRVRVECASPGAAPEALELRRPATARPWWPDGPFGTVLATGTRPQGTGALCDADLERTDAAPGPAVVTVGDDAAWTILLG